MDTCGLLFQTLLVVTYYEKRRSMCLTSDIWVLKCRPSIKIVVANSATFTSALVSVPFIYKSIPLFLSLTEGLIFDGTTNPVHPNTIGSIDRHCQVGDVVQGKEALIFIKLPFDPAGIYF